MDHEPSDDLARRSLRVFQRTAQHLECPVEELVARLEEGRLWFMVHLLEQARDELDVGPRAGDGEGVARERVERALGWIQGALKVFRGLEAF